MRFITEEDLRDLYKLAPFISYDQPEDTRLTPGARQFLVDRGIDMYNRDIVDSGKKPKISANKSERSNEGVLKIKQIQARMKSLQGLFLEEIFLAAQKDPTFTQELSVLSRQLLNLEKICPDWKNVTNLSCHECTGIKEENFGLNIGDCFEITEFHLQIENAEKIIRLNQLRNQLHELALVVQEACLDAELETGACEEFEKKLYQMINTLNRMICAAFGGEKCLRKE